MGKKRLSLVIIIAVLAFGCISEPSLSPTPGPSATPAPPRPVDTSRAGGFAA